MLLISCIVVQSIGLGEGKRKLEEQGNDRDTIRTVERDRAEREDKKRVERERER